MSARSISNLALIVVVLLLGAAGCPSPSAGPAGKVPTTAKPGQPTPLKLLVVDDVPLGKAIAREWTSRTEGELNVQTVSRAELLTASRLPGDVVVFPSGLIGQLAERGLIAPLKEDALADEHFNRRDIFDQVRLREMAWGNKSLAVPLGSPHLLLVYRRDLFEKLSLAPPRTWKEYQAAVDRLAASSAITKSLAAAGDMPIAPSLEPLADGWAGQTLLARAAAYVTHRDQVSSLLHYTTLDPLITAKPYVRALEEFVAARKGHPPKQRLTPFEAMEELKAGRVAMAVTWPSPVREKSATSALPLAFAILPGADEVYNFARDDWEGRESGEESHVPLLAVSGRMAAISTSAADSRAAQNFLVWLAGSEASAIVSPASADTTLFRESQLGGSGRWAPGLDAAAARSYAEALHQANSLQRHLEMRLPGRDDYLAALDVAVQEAAAGEKSPAEALAEAAQKWKEITLSLGLENQRRALRRDLGLETLP